MTFGKDNVRIFKFPAIPAVLLDSCEHVRYDKGDVILIEDKPIAGSYCVISGRVCGYVEGSDGGKIIMAIIEEGGSFGEGDIFLGYSDVSATFVAESDCELLFVGRDHLIDFMGDRDVALYMVCSVSKKFLSTARMYVDSVEGSALRRVCGAFLDLDARYGEESDGIRLIETEVSQQYLAEYLGLSRLTVNKCVGRLRDQKLIRKVDGRYWIPSRNKLIDYMTLLG